MSLTRAEWEEIWELVAGLERDSDYLHFVRRDVSDRMKRRCARIKVLIQSVIGQME
jgi:hypothetical protein